jgi:hypothetical protein
MMKRWEQCSRGRADSFDGAEPENAEVVRFLMGVMGDFLSD